MTLKIVDENGVLLTSIDEQVILRISELSLKSLENTDDLYEEDFTSTMEGISNIIDAVKKYYELHPGGSKDFKVLEPSGRSVMTALGPDDVKKCVKCGKPATLIMVGGESYCSEHTSDSVDTGEGHLKISY